MSPRVPERAMPAISLHERSQIEAYLRQDALAHVYELGDLDDGHWASTIWFGQVNQGKLEALSLLYIGLASPTLLALGGEEPPLTRLVKSILPCLPVRFYSHLSPGVETVLAHRYRLTSHGPHYKMGLVAPSALDAVDTAGADRLDPEQLPELLEFYASNYPDHWFEPPMLEEGWYFGIRDAFGLAAVAGTHVYSRQYAVAALGNITTRKDRRGKGLGRVVTGALCKALLRSVRHIGLNVKADNAAAIRCYERIGFKILADYGEFAAELRDL